MKLLAASLALVFPLCNAAALRTVGHDRRELQGGSLAAVELINSANGSLVRALANGDVIDISTIAGMTTPTFNINASVSADVKSVKFGHNGNDGYRVENNALFAFCGNKGPVFNACSDLGLGQHTVTVSTFAVTAAAGQALSSITVTFTIVNGANGGPAPVSGPVPIPTSAPIAAPMPAPVPVPVPVPVAVPVPTMPNTNCKVPKLVGSWSSGKSHPFPVAEAQGAMIGKDFVIMGGFRAGYGSVSTQTHSLDTTNPNANWVRQDDYPFSKGITHGAFTVVGSKFYICGGYAGGGIGMHTDVCMVYDHSQPKGQGKQWSTFTKLPDGGRAGGHMVHDSTLNALVVSGGAIRPIPNKRTAIDKQNTWTYSLSDPSAGWVSKAPMPFQANHMSAVTARDASGKERHYYTGGQRGEDEHDGNVSDHYEYDAVNDVWTKRKFMSFPRSHHASSARAIGCGFIVVAGCTNGGNKIKDISYYDVPTDSWTKIGELTNNINTPVCDISNGTLFCNTGYDSGGFAKKISISL